MEITFVAHSRLLGYMPGDIVKKKYEDLTDLEKAVIKAGRHLTLIDPLELPDGSRKSTNNPKEHRPADAEHNGHKNPPSSGGSKEGASGNTGSGD